MRCRSHRTETTLKVVSVLWFLLQHLSIWNKIHNYSSQSDNSCSRYRSREFVSWCLLFTTSPGMTFFSFHLVVKMPPGDICCRGIFVESCWCQLVISAVSSADVSCFVFFCWRLNVCYSGKVMVKLCGRRLQDICSNVAVYSNRSIHSIISVDPP